MKLLKTIFCGVLIATAVSTLVAMDANREDDFIPALSRRAKRHAKKAAAAASTDAPPVAPTLYTAPVAPKLSRAAKRAAAAKASAAAASASLGGESQKDSTPLEKVDELIDTLKEAKSNLDKERDVRKASQLFGSNKLKVFVGLFVIAEAVDFAQALVKTSKEELQDKTVAQTAQLIAQKMYTAKLLGAAKDGLMNRVVPGILDLKQKAQDYIQKKKQTA